ncbi:putative uncharacterized protein [Clostridium sp. CAG:354]|jgi:hypothetical protein|nr:hypothetical protein [Clostridium sp.]CDE10649.1 putative uncharacterized protein [Clostridium sp. CAG:354]
MLLKERYEYLNSKINLDKEFIVPYETIMDYYNQMNDIMDNPEIWQEANEDVLNIAELYNLYYGIMSFSIEPKEEDKNFKIKALYSSIFVTIANSITAVIYLAENGLDYQANVINRQLFEICMLLLNVMIDENKEKILTDTEMTEGNMKIWRKYFSPKELNDTIENYEKADLTDWRKRQYSFYSNYSHNDFLSFLFFSFSSPKNEKDKLFNNVWGGYISRVNTILENMISFLWYTSKAFMKLLVDKDIHISKETLRTEEELWKFSIYTGILLDRYYFDYFMNKNSK